MEKARQGSRHFEGKDEETTGQADLLGQPGPLAPHRVLGDLGQDVLAALQDVLEVVRSRPGVSTSADPLLAAGLFVSPVCAAPVASMT